MEGIFVTRAFRMHDSARAFRMHDSALAEERLLIEKNKTKRVIITFFLKFCLMLSSFLNDHKMNINESRQ